MKLRVVVFVVIGLITTTIAYAWSGKPLTDKAAQIALNANGPAALAEGGRRQITVTTASPKFELYNDVKRLSADSEFVIVGVPVHQASHLSSPTSNIVWTDYRVRVLSVLKGEIKQNRLISVRIMGGRVKLEDGSEFETRMPDFWKNPAIEQGYVMFLSRQSEEKFYFKPTGGPQGLFQISPWKHVGAGDLALSTEQVIVPQVRPSDTLMKSYQGKSAEDFLGNLRRVIALGRRGV
jgi:hypothetical protein